MLENLTINQKYFLLFIMILLILSIVCAIYFGVKNSNKPHPCITTPSASPVFYGWQSHVFNSRKLNNGDCAVTTQWLTPTYYTYSYVNSAGEGKQSVPSAAVVSKDINQTNPIMGFTPLSSNDTITIKVYRSLNLNSPFLPLDNAIIDYTNFVFTDICAPPQPTPQVPPQPTASPSFSKWTPSPTSNCPSGSTALCKGNCTNATSSGCLAGDSKGYCANNAFVSLEKTNGNCYTSYVGAEQSNQPYCYCKTSN